MFTYIAITILSILIIICIFIIIYMKFIVKPDECPVCLECAQKCISHCTENGDLSLCKLCLLKECANSNE